MKKNKINIVGLIFLAIFFAISIFVFVSKGSNQGVDFDYDSYKEENDIISVHNLHVDAKVKKDNTIYIT